MFFFTSKHIRHGRQFLKDARKLLAYKRDLVSPDVATEVESGIGRLEAAVKAGGPEEIEARMHDLDGACSKLSQPHPDAGWRENVEVILVAIVIALGVRTYFLQPFTIPTGSMQPTLNGIKGYPTTEAPPNAAARACHFFIYGRTYVDVVAKDDEMIIDHSEEKRFLIFTYTRLRTTKGNEYWVHAPQKTLFDAFLSHGPQQYKAGEPIVRGYIETGDHVFVDKMSYNFRKPHRSEVFVFTTEDIPMLTPHGMPSQFFIKRLAGTPGDTLRIEPPWLFINGAVAKEPPFQRVMSGRFHAPKDGYQGYSNGPEGRSFEILGTPLDTHTLEEGKYFALGDNSYNSLDSRAWGDVPERNIMGHGVFVYWPFSSHWGFIH